MILLGIAFLVLGLLLFPLAYRGRISARGQFCRKCTFDLAGSPIEDEGNKCPECGEPIHTQTSRRTSLRRSSGTGLIAAVVLLLAGLSGIGFGITGNSAAVYATMPDAVIVRLSTFGSDGALDDLVLRLTRTPPLSPVHWDSLVERALAHQADSATTWDPRWGEVLYQAAVNGQMSDDQLKQYALNGITNIARIRDRAQQGADGLGYKIISLPSRTHGITGGKTGYQMAVAVKQTGIVEQAPLNQIFGGTTKFSYEIEIANHAASWSRSMGGRIQTEISRPMFDADPGTELTAFIEYEIKMTRISDDSTVFIESTRIEQAVTVLDRDTPVVGFIKLPPARLLTCEHSVSPINLVNPIPEAAPSYGMTVLVCHLYLVGLIEPVAFRASFVFEDEEVEFGTMSAQGTPAKTNVQMLIWRVSQEERAAAQHTITRLLEQGRVDIILRPDPSIAIDNPDIQQIMGLTLRFKDVPINTVLSESAVWNVQRGVSIDASCKSN
jgi:hypothetical protein